LICPEEVLLYFSWAQFLPSLLVNRLFISPVRTDVAAESTAQSKEHRYNMEAGMPRFSPALS
jgi:hypothetical protein